MELHTGFTFRRGRSRWAACAVILALVATGFTFASPLTAHAAVTKTPTAFAVAGSSLVVADSDGRISTWRGGSPAQGSLEHVRLNAPIVSAAGHPGGKGNLVGCI